MGFLNYNKIFDIDILNLETGCNKIRDDFDHGVKPLIHQSELGTYTKVIPFQEKGSFHFVVL
jgi:hypothetical protein